MKHIIKREARSEEFSDKKLKMSIFAACLNAHLSDEEADIIADKVTLAMKEWVYKTEKDITSDELFKKALEALTKLNEAAGYMYSSHRDV